MRYALQYCLSLIFIGQMYVMMLLMGIFFFPLAVISRENAVWAVHTYTRWVRWTASWMIGLKSEVRGPVPDGELIVCPKHQSFFDIIIIVSVLPRPRFIMKAQLKFAPILGYFGFRIGCVPVNRGKGAKAIKQMVDGVEKMRDFPGQLIIYPQGTRVAPGVKKPYKIGSGVLYEGLRQACVPAATNVGVFWPRHGIYRRPGLAVVEFLPVIEQGLTVDTFMQQLEEEVESHSDRLMQEAGFDVENARWP
ncbi:MAG: 1-acyl-sn-glycerol-3-phosphate acyltransferase [Rhodobacteraceae bacterium]|nr:1-acyl-sn-glycerol-3-phosphate acyltransferase [Paracoccaceae bacterium]